MHIVGLGIDICKNIRIENLIKKYKEKFLIKVFHLDEIDNCLERYGDFEANYFAKRFSGKEAFVKALGVGFNSYIRKNEIAILNDEIYRKPFVILFGETKKYVEEKYGDNLNFLISMSDEDEFSVSNVMIVGK